MPDKDKIQQALIDFDVTIKAKPNLSDKELLSKFPEFGNDINKLQAAKDYSATLNSGKYKDPSEFNSKFPEFFAEEVKKKEPTASSATQLPLPKVLEQGANVVSGGILSDISKTVPKTEPKEKVRSKYDQPKQNANRFLDIGEPVVDPNFGKNKAGLMVGQVPNSKPAFAPELALRKGELQGRLANVLSTGKRPTNDELGQIAMIQSELQSLPQSQADAAFQKDGWSIFKKDPLLGAEFLGETVLSSLTSLFEAGKRTVPAAIGIGAAAGAPIAGIGAIGGAISGLTAGVTTGGFNLSTSGKIIQTLSDEGVDVADRDSLIAAFSDEAKMAKIRNRALKYGIPIAVLDAISGGFAGKLVAGAAGKSLAKRTLAGFGEIGMQSVAGMAGEAGGQYLADGKLNRDEILLEGIAGLVTDVPEIVSGVAMEKLKDRSSSKKTLAKQVAVLGSEIGSDDAKYNLNRDLANNVITPEEHEQGIAFVEKAVEANNKIPEIVIGDNRSKSIELIEERDRLTEEVNQREEQKKGIDVAYHKVLDESNKEVQKRIDEINNQLGELAKPEKNKVENETVEIEKNILDKKKEIEDIKESVYQKNAEDIVYGFDKTKNENEVKGVFYADKNGVLYKKNDFGAGGIVFVEEDISKDYEKRNRIREEDLGGKDIRPLSNKEALPLVLQNERKWETVSKDYFSEVLIQQNFELESLEKQLKERQKEQPKVAQPKKEVVVEEVIQQPIEEVVGKVKLYHGTYSDIKQFETQKDSINGAMGEELGVHFGTKDAAIDRLKENAGDEDYKKGGVSKGGKVIETEVEIKNPIKVKIDVGDWSDINKVKESLSEIFSLSELEGINNINELRQFIISKGYDSIEYPNNYEGKKGDKSYIIIDPSIAKIKNVELFDKEKTPIEEQPELVEAVRVEQEPETKEGVKVVTLSGMIEEDRAKAVEERKKKTTLTEKETLHNDLIDLANRADKARGNEKTNLQGQIRQRVRELNAKLGEELYKYDGVSVRAKVKSKTKGERYLKIKGTTRDTSGRAIKEDAVLLFDRSPEFVQKYEELADSPNITSLQVDSGNGVTMTAEQIEAALQDIADGIPSVQADNLLNALEEGVKNGYFDLRGEAVGQKRIQAPIEDFIGVEQEEVGQPLDEDGMVKWLNEIAELPQEEQIEIDNIILEYEQQPQQIDISGKVQSPNAPSKTTSPTSPKPSKEGEGNGSPKAEVNKQPIGEAEPKQEDVEDADVFYHSTNKDFEGFDDKKIGTNKDFGWFGLGHYFTSNKEESKYYGKNVIEINISKIKDKIYKAVLSNQSIKIPKSVFEYIEKNLKNFKDYELGTYDNFKVGNLIDKEGSKVFSDAFKNEGYLGVRVSGDANELVIFESKNIPKSEPKTPLEEKYEQINKLRGEKAKELAKQKLISDNFDSIVAQLMTKNKIKRKC